MRIEEKFFYSSQIILIQNCKKINNSRYNKGNVPFELKISQSTKISEIGTIEIMKNQESIKKIKNFKNIRPEKGFISILMIIETFIDQLLKYYSNFYLNTY